MRFEKLTNKPVSRFWINYFTSIPDEAAEIQILFRAIKFLLFL
jgi:hypothetical protein